jgi:putative transposase
MDLHSRGAHSVFSIHLHLVWVTKYRKAALAGAEGVPVRDLIRVTCGVNDVQKIRGHVSNDHVLLLVSIPFVVSGIPFGSAFGGLNWSRKLPRRLP